MKKGVLIGIIVAALIILGLFLFLSGDRITEVEKESSQSAENENSVNAANVVEITSAGFNPSMLEIKQGDRVTFVNKDSGKHWPASAMHPTHTVYPGSDIKKCGTDEDNMIFDSCKGLKQNEAWSFVFNEKGSWGYHDHLSAKLFGKIVVS